MYLYAWWCMGGDACTHELVYGFMLLWHAYVCVHYYIFYQSVKSFWGFCLFTLKCGIWSLRYSTQVKLHVWHAADSNLIFSAMVSRASPGERPEASKPLWVWPGDPSIPRDPLNYQHCRVQAMQSLHVQTWNLWSIWQRIAWRSPLVLLSIVQEPLPNCFVTFYRVITHGIILLIMPLKK